MNATARICRSLTLLGAACVLALGSPTVAMAVDGEILPTVDTNPTTPAIDPTEGMTEDPIAHASPSPTPVVDEGAAKAAPEITDTTEVTEVATVSDGGHPTAVAGAVQAPQLPFTGSTSPALIALIGAMCLALGALLYAGGYRYDRCITR